MKNVLIVVIGNTGSEAEALRQSLEAFGYFVAVKYTGRPNEPRGNMSASDIDKYLKLQDKLILNLGCTTGETAIAEALSKQNTYIAPDDYIEGNAALYFAISLFYEMSKDGVRLGEAFEVAKAKDRETELFQMFR